MFVPEISDEIRAFKDSVGRFVEAEVYPLETRIAERGSIDPAELDAVRRTARDAGFSMLNMPPDLGGRDLSMLGQVALEEESGKATNGLGFAVVDRGSRELHEIATPEAPDVPRVARLRRSRGPQGRARKVSMAKLFASEMAGRVADRAVQALGGRGYMVENAAARFYRELRVDRIWERTSEIQRSITCRGVFKRGAAPYLN